MSHQLVDAEAYRRTLAKLEVIRGMLSKAEDRVDLSPIHREDTTRSYAAMIRELESEIAAFEGTQTADLLRET